MALDPNDHLPTQSTDSLKATLKKRRTETTLRAMEESRQRAASHSTSTPNELRHPNQPASTYMAEAAASPSPAAQSIVGLSTVYASRRRWLIGLGAVLLVIMIGVLVTSSSHIVSVVTASVAPPRSVVSANQVVGANQVVNQFKKVGLPISSQRNIPVSSNDWKASQEILFDIRQDGETGSFIMLSYSDQKALDVAKVTSDPRFKDWQVLTANNVILLISPQTSPKLRAQIGSYLTQSLSAPVQPGGTSDTSQS